MDLVSISVADRRRRNRYWCSPVVSHYLGDATYTYLFDGFLSSFDLSGQIFLRDVVVRPRQPVLQVIADDVSRVGASMCSAIESGTGGVISFDVPEFEWPASDRLLIETRVRRLDDSEGDS